MSDSNSPQPSGWLSRWWLAVIGLALIIGGALVAQGSWALLPNNGDVTPGSSTAPLVSGFVQPEISVLIYVGQSLVIAGIVAALASVALRVLRGRHAV
ncbi:hypothetical protein ACFOYW_14140 [Gryllotalpicola reticulitermitis]|uniref:Uncharacterized protein n=1 Tax=Gryllotalpicola reticulitermitis TaxID=1184153 RepID=A0ABV8QA46_9MICO